MRVVDTHALDKFREWLRSVRAYRDAVDAMLQCIELIDLSDSSTVDDFIDRLDDAVVDLTIENITAMVNGALPTHLYLDVAGLVSSLNGEVGDLLNEAVEDLAAFEEEANRPSDYLSDWGEAFEEGAA